MSKLAERLRKDAPKFGLEEFDPTFDLRQQAADALDAAEKALRLMREAFLDYDGTHGDLERAAMDAAVEALARLGGK